MTTKKTAKVKEVGSLKKPGEVKKRGRPANQLTARVAALEAEVRQLRDTLTGVVNGLAERVAAQSELLSERAEATPVPPVDVGPLVLSAPATAFDGATPMTSTVAGYRSQS